MEIGSKLCLEAGIFAVNVASFYSPSSFSYSFFYVHIAMQGKVNERPFIGIDFLYVNIYLSKRLFTRTFSAGFCKGLRNCRRRSGGQKVP